MIERLGSKSEVRTAVAGARMDGQRIALVPTMGALHEGHLSLVRAARARAEFVVVSIFVNPTQFGEGEDYESYPRKVDEDLIALSEEGAAVAFVPTSDVMYAPDAQTSVEPGPVAARWEGACRPGHFGGMATVVTKLLNIVRPDLAFFGEKDYQQLQVVRRIVLDLDLGAGIVGVPIVRDADGLALSSRNVFLSAPERAQALSLSAALAAAERAVAWGESSAASIEQLMRETIAGVGGGAVDIDYAAVVDPVTLEPLTDVIGPARALIAARVGATRLIDNVALVPAPVGERA